MDENLKFDWDQVKEVANERKHGVTFVGATAVFDDPALFEENVTRPEHREQRVKAVGRVGSVVLAVVYTDRQERGASFQRGGPANMSENTIVRARRLSDGTVVEELPDGSTRPLPDRTDWARLESMTEEEIEANTLSDPDNPPLTDEELARMRPVPNPRRIRERLKLTQEQFADQFEVPLGTLRDWEQEVSYPDRAARTLLRVIDKDPDAVINALARTYLSPGPASPDTRS